MKRFQLLLLDAGVVMEAWRLGIWSQLVARCDVHLAQTVVDEAQFFEDDLGEKQYIDLQPYIDSGQVHVFNLTPTNLATFRGQFRTTYFERLDPGETESLAYLMMQKDPDWHICSADAIVYRVLGTVGRPDQGLSLEEILGQVGLTHKLEQRFRKDFRTNWTQKGFADGLTGLSK